MGLLAKLTAFDPERDTFAGALSDGADRRSSARSCRWSSCRPASPCTAPCTSSSSTTASARERRPSTWSPPPRRSRQPGQGARLRVHQPQRLLLPGFPRAEPRCVPVALSVEKTQTRATPTSAPRPLSPAAEVLPSPGGNPGGESSRTPVATPVAEVLPTPVATPVPLPLEEDSSQTFEPTFLAGAPLPPPRDSTRGGGYSRTGVLHSHGRRRWRSAACPRGSRRRAHRRVARRLDDSVGRPGSTTCQGACNLGVSLITDYLDESDGEGSRRKSSSTAASCCCLWWSATTFACGTVPPRLLQQERKASSSTSGASLLSTSSARSRFPTCAATTSSLGSATPMMKPTPRALKLTPFPLYTKVTTLVPVPVMAYLAAVGGIAATLGGIFGIAHPLHLEHRSCWRRSAREKAPPRTPG